MRFLGAGLATALLDNGIFFVLNRATGMRPLSFLIATAVSVAFNYIVVRSFIFEANVSHASALPKFLGVHGAGMIVRYAIFEGLIAFFHIPPKHLAIYGVKLLADGVVYSFKYVIQRDFVFRNSGAATRNATPESDQSGSPAVPGSVQPAPRP